MRSAEIKMENLDSKNYEFDPKLMNKLQHLHDSLTKEYENVKLNIEGDWYKGQNRPYEVILNNLTKQGYILTDFEERNFVPFGDEKPDKYKKLLSIDLKNDWNMEDATKIKNIIIKPFPFEPTVDKYATMTWTGSKYDVQLYETSGGKIRIIFMTK